MPDFDAEELRAKRKRMQAEWVELEKKSLCNGGQQEVADENEQAEDADNDVFAKEWQSNPQEPNRQERTGATRRRKGT